MLAIYRKSPSLTSLCLAGLLLRLAGIFYGVYHDARHALKYTDIDYLVFSDATSFLLAPSSHTHNHATGPLGRHLPLGSPYTRETYRYTPLLALLLTPNAIHPLWGKLLFALADVALGLLLYKSLHLQRSKHPKLLVSFAWLFNPLPINIATRGSSEALLGVMVLACLYAAQTHRWNLCAILLGLATHFKIYPAIYAVSLVGHLSQFHLRSLFQKRTIVFGLLAFISFSTLTLVMYLIWGEPFLQETYFYHVHRLDHRHNFSSAFYPISLSASANPLSNFIPQLILTFTIGALFSQDLPLAWFLQTAVFVTFNKVCTSQYFLWYLWLLPLIVDRLHMSRREAIALAALWVLGQAAWLKLAYDLEMLGEPVHFQLWLASLVFQIINIAIIGRIIDAASRHLQFRQKHQKTN